MRLVATAIYTIKLEKNLKITFDKLAVEVLSTYLIDDSPVYHAVSVHLCRVVC